MKYLVIILFLIFIISSITIQIDIKHLEIINKKIKFNIYIKLYLFKKIKIFSKKIKKKDILKLVELSSKNNDINKAKKIFKKINSELEEIGIDIQYGIKNIKINTCLYIIVNTVIPSLICKYANNKTKINYNVKNNYNANYFYCNYKSKINIDIIKSIF